MRYINIKLVLLSLLLLLLTVFATSGKDWQAEWNFAHTAVFMNSCINPVLYCWRLRELRAAVVKTTREMLCKVITYRAKLLNPDWLRQRAFFLNHEGTFGNQEGMIT